MSPKIDYYDALGLVTNASRADVKKSFLTLLPKHPPEKDPEGYKKIREAYDILYNETSRSEYDSLLEYGAEVEKLQAEATELTTLDPPEYEEAIEILKKAVVLAPEVGLLRVVLGGWFQKSGKHAEALTQFERALKIDPTNRSYLIQRGETLQSLKRLQDAEQSFQKAWDLEKGDYEAPRALASLYFESGRIAEAHKILDEAIGIDGKVDFQDFICILDKLHYYLLKIDQVGLKKQLKIIRTIAKIPNEKKFAAYMLGKTAYSLYDVNAYELANSFLTTARVLDPQDEYLRKLHESSNKLKKIEDLALNVFEDPGYHEFVKYTVTVFAQHYLGRSDDDEYGEQFRNLAKAYQNVMSRDPDNATVKKSVRKLKVEKPSIYRLSEKFYEEILSSPPASQVLLPCPYCGDKILIDKLMRSNGSCPHCQRSIQYNGLQLVGASFGDQCFVATAVYESHIHPDVIFLRQFRDRKLVQSVLGKSFVKLYYAIGPLCAQRVNAIPPLKLGVRKILEKLVLILKAYS
ncbi:MAG: DnaJ domain-containing protein [Ignavibacteriales bacterium]|nr:DnaJ domain-containing protein [Ignavibacteriales bacterium]